MSIMKRHISVQLLLALKHWEIIFKFSEEIFECHKPVSIECRSYVGAQPKNQTRRPEVWPMLSGDFRLWTDLKSKNVITTSGRLHFAAWVPHTHTYALHTYIFAHVLCGCRMTWVETLQKIFSECLMFWTSLYYRCSIILYYILFIILYYVLHNLHISV